MHLKKIISPYSIECTGRSIDEQGERPRYVGKTIEGIHYILDLAARQIYLEQRMGSFSDRFTLLYRVLAYNYQKKEVSVMPEDNPEIIRQLCRGFTKPTPDDLFSNGEEQNE